MAKYNISNNLNNSFNNNNFNSLGTGRKLNVRKTLRRSPAHLLNVLYTFNLRHVSRGNDNYNNVISAHV